MCIDTLHIKFIKGMTDEDRRLIRRNRDLEEDILHAVVANPEYINMGIRSVIIGSAMSGLGLKNPFTSGILDTAVCVSPLSLWLGGDVMSKRMPKASRRFS